MLASTMQISNNNPTNTLNHPPGDLEQREEQKAQPHTTTRLAPGAVTVQLIPQDPTVCLTPPPPTRGLGEPSIPTLTGTDLQCRRFH